MSILTSVLDFGAKADGVANDFSAIQAALDKGGQIFIPAGTYKIGSTLRIGSNTKIVAHHQARLFMGEGVGVNRDSFLLTSKPQSKNIWIEGGIWDGNNLANPRSEGIFSTGYTGTLLNFVNLEDLTLKNITVRNPEAFFIRFCELRRFLIDGVVFQAQNLRPNQDGLHFGGFCEDGEIRNIRSDDASTPNDDVIALNADDAITRVINQGMKCGPQQRIKIENISVRDAHTIIRMLSIDSPIEDIEIKNIKGGFQTNFLNADAARYCLTPIFDEADPKYANGVGCLRNISIRNVSTYKSSGTNTSAFLRLETRMENFCIDNFTRNYRLDIDENMSIPTILLAKTPVRGLCIEGLIDDETKAILKNDLNIKLGFCPGYFTDNLSKNNSFMSYCKRFDHLSIKGFQL